MTLRKDVHRLFSFVLLVTSLTLLSFATYRCTEKYLRREITVSIEIKRPGEATFLALTTCPDYSTAYVRSYLAAHNLTVRDVRGGRVTRGRVSARQFFLEASQSLEDLVEQFMITTRYGLGQDSQRYHYVTPTNHSYLWRTNWYLLYGRCYTFQVPPDILKLGVEDAIFSFRSNVYVFLHHPGQFTSSDSKTKVSSEMGRKLFLDINYDLMENIPMRRDDFALGAQSLTCDPTLDFGYDDCIYSGVRAALMVQYGCVPPYVTNLDAGDHVCHMEDWSMEQQKQIKRSYHKLFFEEVPAMTCNAPCATLSLVLGMPFYSRETDGDSSVKLYFKSATKVRKSVYAYTELSLLAEFGGYLGLLMGVSLLDLIGISRWLLGGRKKWCSDYVDVE